MCKRPCPDSEKHGYGSSRSSGTGHKCGAVAIPGRRISISATPKKKRRRRKGGLEQEEKERKRKKNKKKSTGMVIP